MAIKRNEDYNGSAEVEEERLDQYGYCHGRVRLCCDETERGIDNLVVQVIRQQL